MSTPNTRRRFQFTLRMVFVVMTVSVTCVWLGWDVVGVWQRKTMIAWIESQGGHVWRFRDAEEIKAEEQADEEQIAEETATLSRQSAGSQQATPDEKVDDERPKDSSRVPADPAGQGVADFNSLIDQAMASQAENLPVGPDDPPDQLPFQTNLVLEIGGGQELVGRPPKPAPQLRPLRRWLGDAAIETINAPPSATPADIVRIEALFPEADVIKPRPRSGAGGGFF